MSTVNISGIPSVTVNNVLGYLLTQTNLSHALSIVEAQNPQVLQQCEREMQCMILQTLGYSKQEALEAVRKNKFADKANSFFSDQEALKKLADKRTEVIKKKNPERFQDT